MRKRFLDAIGILEEAMNIVARINDQEAIQNMVFDWMRIPPGE